jgi:hypothetical protein
VVLRVSVGRRYLEGGRGCDGGGVEATGAVAGLGWRRVGAIVGLDDALDEEEGISKRKVTRDRYRGLSNWVKRKTRDALRAYDEEKQWAQETTTAKPDGDLRSAVFLHTSDRQFTTPISLA